MSTSTSPSLMRKKLANTGSNVGNSTHVLTLQHWPLEKLKPYANNPRRNDEAVSQMCNAIREMGFKVPIIVRSDGEVVDGHLRLKAAKQLGLTEVPVLLADDLTPTQVKAFRILVNQSAHWADWDGELLRAEIQQLLATDFDLSLIGFADAELDKILASTDEDSSKQDEIVPTPEKTVITRVGDCWQLGKHRALCGDATIRADVGALMQGEIAQMAFTDPPYNVDYGSTPRNEQRGYDNHIANDNLHHDFYGFLRKALENLLAVTEGACYIAMAGSELDVLKRAFTDAGGKWSTFIIWVKNSFVVGRADYHRQYEPLLYGWRADVTRHWCGSRDQSDTWFIDRPRRNDLHPTMKPIALVEKAITNSSRRGDIVLDTFAGSGSTLMACERTGRAARLLELEPRYVDVIVRRWQQYTGQKAVRLNDGILFDELGVNFQ